METLYCPQVFMPEWFVAPTDDAMLKWTHHAKRAASNDPYDNIKRVETLALRRFRVIEIGVVDGEVSKIVFRGQHNKRLDIVYVLVPEGDNNYLVKTVWLNLKSDTHKTLRTSRYAKS